MLEEPALPVIKKNAIKLKKHFKTQASVSPDKTHQRP